MARLPNGWVRRSKYRIQNEETGYSITRLEMDAGVRYQVSPKKKAGRVFWPDYHKSIGTFDDLKSAVKRANEHANEAE